jgi:hypothetical protein
LWRNLIHTSVHVTSTLAGDNPALGTPVQYREIYRHTAITTDDYARNRGGKKANENRALRGSAIAFTWSLYHTDAGPMPCQFTAHQLRYMALYRKHHLGADLLYAQMTIKETEVVAFVLNLVFCAITKMVILIKLPYDSF